ncbi:MAG TPA: hypothetical protein VKB88_05900 [Bryobacteraceae bacterium]|nr:hypothetical protein [Bryobacteraceae bacterium]
MDLTLRRAWTEVVTAEDYEQHMAAIGQAQAAAELTRHLIDAAAPAAGSRVVVAGAGTGQMLDYLDPAFLRPYRLAFADLNWLFLARLRARLARHALEAALVVDDIERSSLAHGPDLLLATLLLEHIDWRRGVEAFAALNPSAMGIIIQENPPEMTTAVTPGRRLPPSIANALENAHPTLVPRGALIAAMAECGNACRLSVEREVADGKKLVGLLFD